MEGGRYVTFFKDDEKRELRVFLYKLEGLGILKLTREKTKPNLYNYRWGLTEKGKILVEKNKILQKYWEEREVEKFYNYIKNLLEIL